MEAMKTEMSMFFSSHAGELAVLRTTTTQGLGSLQAEHNSLKERISQADHKHQTVSPSPVCEMLGICCLLLL